MDPAVRLASTVADPLVSQLLLPVEATPDNAQTQDELLARLVSFRGETPPLSYESLLSVVGELVALTASGYRLLPQDEAPVAGVLSRTLWIAGELDTTDVQAVRLGPQDFARKLRSAVPGADRELSPDAAWFHDRLLVTVCLHLLHHLIRRSPRLAERMPERAHRIRQLIDLNDVEAVRGRPEPSAIDAEFEVRYARSVVEQYNRVTIYGIDLPNPNTPDNWSLDATYLSLSAEFDNPEDRTEAAPPRADGDSGEPVLPADRALGGHERVLLRGVAGSGKTTLVQWLAVSTARDALPPELASLRGRIPFVLPVRRFAREGFPPRTTSCAAVRHPLADEAPDGWGAGCCTEGAALLLVDGIDEAPESERRAAARPARRADAQLLGQLLPGHVPSLGRGANWLADEGFDELTLAPMNRDQVAAFITAGTRRPRRRRGQGPPPAGRVRATSCCLHTALPRAARLATNPLMCGLICALQPRQVRLPAQGPQGAVRGGDGDAAGAPRPRAARAVRGRDRAASAAPASRLLRKLAYRMLVDAHARADHGRGAGRRSPGTCPPSPHGAARAARGRSSTTCCSAPGCCANRPTGAVEFVHRTVAGLPRGEGGGGAGRLRPAARPRARGRVGGGHQDGRRTRPPRRVREAAGRPAGARPHRDAAQPAPAAGGRLPGARHGAGPGDPRPRPPRDPPHGAPDDRGGGPQPGLGGADSAGDAARPAAVSPTARRTGSRSR